MTGVYSVFVLVLMWVLPLFPAQPKLGPVYQNITHMVPLPFQLLLIVPAFFLDLIWPIFKDAPASSRFIHPICCACRNPTPRSRRIVLSFAT